MPKSSWGRGITCTLTTSPIRLAAFAPASVAALTAATSPVTNAVPSAWGEAKIRVTKYSAGAPAAVARPEWALGRHAFPGGILAGEHIRGGHLPGLVLDLVPQGQLLIG